MRQFVLFFFQAKKMYTSESGRRSISPARELSDNVSEAGSNGRRVSNRKSVEFFPHWNLIICRRQEAIIET